MEQIYLDNASTSFPKPKCVADGIYRYLSECGCNINRGSYRGAYAAEEVVFQTRRQISELFHGPDCRNVVFTRNITESLNVILKGFLKPGDHVIVSAMEHNAVMRPLTQLRRQGVTFSRIPCRPDGTLMIETVPALIRGNTRAVVMLHGSNVCGTLMPLSEVGAICRRYGLRFIVDTAQTAGTVPIDMQAMGIDALAFTGHKGLLGPQGIGGFLLQEEMVPLIEPLICGGTGSISHSEEIPTFMPDRFEAGTPNLPGIFGLHAALSFLNDRGIDTIRKHELGLAKQFLNGMPEVPHLRVIGRKETEGRCAVVSVQPTTVDPALLADALEREYGIMVRVGLHCAPSAHRVLGTYPAGTVRFSFGWANTAEEVDTALRALVRLMEKNTWN